MIRYVEKPLQRVKHLIVVTLTFQIYCSSNVFFSSNDQQCKINVAKSKLIVLKNAKNWASTKLDIW